MSIVNKDSKTLRVYYIGLDVEVKISNKHSDTIEKMLDKDKVWLKDAIRRLLLYGVLIPKYKRVKK